jgi:hypothetical protein
VRLDLYAGKQGYKLLMEMKGDVVDPKYDPAAYRNKHAQIVLGQLICRTGVRQCGYDGHTLLAVGFPDPCKDGSHYFSDYLEQRLAPELRTALKLCVFWVGQDLSVSVEVPDSVQAGLFSGSGQALEPIAPSRLGVARYRLLPAEEKADTIK